PTWRTTVMWSMGPPASGTPNPTPAAGSASTVAAPARVPSLQRLPVQLQPLQHAAQRSPPSRSAHRLFLHGLPTGLHVVRRRLAARDEHLTDEQVVDDRA